MSFIGKGSSVSNQPLVIRAGFAGDLSRRKKFQADWNVHRLLREQRGTNRPFSVIGTDIVPMPNLRSFIDGAAEKHVPNRNLSGWDEFVKNTYEFVPSGESHEASAPLFRKIIDHKRAHPGAPVIFDLSVPYTANIPILAQLRRALRHVEWGKDVFVVLEKPAEITPQGLDDIESHVIGATIPTEHVGIVEHFSLKHGFRQLLEWMYGRATHRAVLRGEHVAKVKLVVHEKIGTEKRLYRGIMLDSVYNHGATLLATLMGNPWDNGFQRIRHSLPPRLGRLYFPARDPSMGEETYRQRRQEFYRKLRPRGIYGVCHEDHCDPEVVPTAVFIRFRPVTNRWGEETVFEYRHVKNTFEKSTRVEFHFRNGDGRPSETWTFHIDAFQHGQRVWGWEKVCNCLLTPDERGKEAVIETYFRSVPPESVDGYPQVHSAYLGVGQPDGRPNMTAFMGLDFQRESLNAFGPWASILDGTPLVERREWFRAGQDPFPEDKLRDEQLVPLEPPLTTV